MGNGDIQDRNPQSPHNTADDAGQTDAGQEAEQPPETASDHEFWENMSTEKKVEELYKCLIHQADVLEEREGDCTQRVKDMDHRQSRIDESIGYLSEQMSALYGWVDKKVNSKRSTAQSVIAELGKGLVWAAVGAGIATVASAGFFYTQGQEDTLATLSGIPSVVGPWSSLGHDWHGWEDAVSISSIGTLT